MSSAEKQDGSRLRVLGFISIALGVIAMASPALAAGAGPPENTIPTRRWVELKLPRKGEPP